MVLLSLLLVSIAISFEAKSPSLLLYKPVNCLIASLKLIVFSSTVELEFDYGTNMEEVVNDVRDKLDRVNRSLPEAASTPAIFRFSGSSSQIMRILVRGNRSVDDIKQIAESTIVDILEQKVLLLLVKMILMMI